MPGTHSIDGLNSGLDTTAIVDSIIEFERTNAYRLEAEQADKGNIITALQAVQAKFLGLSSSISSLTRSSTFQSATINISDDSYLSASSSGQVASGSYDLQVLALARNHQIASQGVADVDDAIIGTGTITIGVGSASGRVLEINSSNNSLVGIKNAINDLNAGVTASIINDGTGENPYRLVIAADKTGAANTINLTTSLAGGVGLEYESGSFDSPETVLMNSQSTSVLSLGASAAYTGSENKTYTFTVAGSGTQTIGSGTITLNWTDGTNSGSIEVTAADTEVALTGAGSDGLTLSFSGGALTAGDTFDVNTFSPLLQTASDARLSLGSSEGGGSPLTVTSSSNTFTDVVAGLTLTAKKVTAAGESVTITTAVDVSKIKDAINSFIESYNGIMEYIEDQNTYNQDTGESGVLFGDITLWTLQNTLRSRASSVIEGLSGKYNQLAAIGIRHNGSGELAIANYTAFDDALNNHLSDVIDLFGNAGQSSSQYIEFISLTDQSNAGHIFNVDITTAAEKGHYAGSYLSDPSSSPITLDSTNNRLKLTVNGLRSNELVLDAGTYSSWSALVDEIQSQIDADSAIGGRGVTVSYDSDEGGSFLVIQSGTYGSKSTVEIDSSQTNNAYTVLRLASGTAHDGLDVAGTINGEEAEGVGQLLTGFEGNDTTEGVKLKITYTADQIVSGTEGDITVTRGIATQLRDIIDSATESVDGTFDRRITGYEKQIEDLVERVADIDERLAMRRESLLLQYWEMEMALGELNAQKAYLDAQIDQLKSNWVLGRGGD